MSLLLHPSLIFIKMKVFTVGCSCKEKNPKVESAQYFMPKMVKMFKFPSQQRCLDRNGSEVSKLKCDVDCFIYREAQEQVQIKINVRNFVQSSFPVCFHSKYLGERGGSWSLRLSFCGHRSNTQTGPAQISLWASLLWQEYPWWDFSGG